MGNIDTGFLFSKFPEFFINFTLRNCIQRCCRLVQNPDLCRFMIQHPRHQKFLRFSTGQGNSIPGYCLCHLGQNSVWLLLYPLRKSRLFQSCPDLILIRLFQRFQRNILRYGIWKNQRILKQYSNLIPDKICLSSGNLRPLYGNFPGRNRIQTA